MTKQFPLRIDQDAYIGIKTVSEITGESLNSLINKAIYHFLKTSISDEVKKSQNKIAQLLSLQDKLLENQGKQ